MKRMENKYINSGISDLIAMFRVWKTKEYAGTSRFVSQYEDNLKSYFNTRYASAVSNGTDAIEVALRSLEIPRGSEVMMPAYAPVMSIIPLIHYGVRPVFVDSEPGVFNLSLSDIENKLTKKTKAILVVPMWGYPIKMKDLRSFCKKHEIKLIEDASHCHGSMLHRKYVGTLSDISAFSTQERKMVATGEGGFLLTNDRRTARKIQSVRDFGKVQDGDKKYPDHVGEYGYYDGSNYRITGVSAAMGSEQIKKIERKVNSRTRNAYQILKSIEGNANYSEIRNVSGGRNNYYSLVLKVGDSAHEIGAFLAQRNIISDTYRFRIRPLYDMPKFAEYKSSCPHTEKLLKSIITVPTHEGLSARDIAFITSTLLEADSNKP